MNFLKWKKKACIFEIFGCIQYMILIFTAMLFYTGGTVDDPSVQGYLFWGNSLSDLGRTIAYSGQINTVSMVIFSFTLFLWAISMIPFYLVLLSLFNETRMQKRLCLVGTVFAIIAAISLVGISFMPDDILDGPHMIFVYIGYASLVIVGAMYSTVFYSDKEFPKIFAYIFIIFTIVHFITSIMGLIGLASLNNLMVIGQKIGRFTTVICFAIVAYGVLKQKKS